MNIGKININITDNCNHRCFYCNLKTDKDRETLNKQEIDILLQKLVSNYNRKGCQFTINGGEPLLYPELIQHFIVELNKLDKDNKININTNFSINNIDFLIELYRLNPFFLHVSIPSLEENDYMQTINVTNHNSYENLINNLTKWIQIVGNNIHVNIVVTKVNLTTIIPTIEKLQSVGITKIHLSPIISNKNQTFLDATNNEVKKVYDFRLSDKEYNEFVLSAKEVMIHKGFLNNITCQPLCFYSKQLLSNIGEMSCANYKTTFKNVPIYPSGKMKACLSSRKDNYIGDIFKEDFEQIVARRISWIESNCNFPFEKCNGCEMSKVKCMGGCIK